MEQRAIAMNTLLNVLMCVSALFCFISFFLWLSIVDVFFQSGELYWDERAEIMDANVLPSSKSTRTCVMCISLLSHCSAYSWRNECESTDVRNALAICVCFPFSLFSPRSVWSSFLLGFCFRCKYNMILLAISVVVAIPGNEHSATTKACTVIKFIASFFSLGRREKLHSTVSAARD